MSMGYFVYIHINKSNGKKYVGITSQRYLSGRWHNGEGYNKQKRFYSAIKHYGWDNFEHIVIRDGLTKEEAETLEQDLIALYRSNDLRFGYNIENGGRTNKLSEDQKQHLRDINTGKKASEETKQKMSQTHIGMARKWMIGKKHTEETKAKMSSAHSGCKNPRAKGVLKYDLNDNFLGRYSTLKEAAESIGEKNTSRISRCCSGERKKAHGYKWKYEVLDG